MNWEVPAPEIPEGYQWDMRKVTLSTILDFYLSNVCKNLAYLIGFWRRPQVAYRRLFQIGPPKSRKKGAKVNFVSVCVQWMHSSTYSNDIHVLKGGPVSLSNGQAGPGRNFSQSRAHLLVNPCTVEPACKVSIWDNENWRYKRADLLSGLLTVILWLGPGKNWP